LGRRRDTHEAAWHYLLTTLKPDVACVQEALASADRLVASYGTIVWSKTKPGGTGVFVRHSVKPTATPASLRGSYVAGVRVPLGSGSLRVFSVHVGPESWKNQETFEPWLISQVQAEPTVVGGDINTSRAYSARHAAFLTHLIEAGVHDCHWAKHKHEVPSFWGRQSRVAKYQDDHWFASRTLADSISDCWIEVNPLTRILSDHGPVVLSLES
jgi:endonuclease/exonuclease/phosphatase family metal-dependent hydrolase